MALDRRSATGKGLGYGDFEQLRHNQVYPTQYYLLQLRISLDAIIVYASIDQACAVLREPVVCKTLQRHQPRATSTQSQ